jgi:exfoliative toxin A/B
MGKFLKKTADMPVGALAATMGAATLSNVWNSLGFVWVRNITMGVALLVWLAFFGKIVFAFKSFRTEYEKVVPCSLYGAFSMLMMILTMWLYQWLPAVAKPLFLCAVFLHAAQILVFTFRNVLRGMLCGTQGITRGITKETFLPCWFVTYNGIMVSTVVGFVHLSGLEKIILYYGIGIYALVIVFMVIRLIRVPVAPQFLHTTPVVLAPVSLCITTYCNVEQTPLAPVIAVLYVMLLLSLIYIIVNIPKYFAVPFNPGFAGLTFPMAIGCVASFRTAAWLGENGFSALSTVIKQISGLQTWLTTGIIAFVLCNFARMALRALQNPTIQNPTIQNTTQNTTQNTMLKGVVSV